MALGQGPESMYVPDVLLPHLPLKKQVVGHVSGYLFKLLDWARMLESNILGLSLPM